MTTFKFENGSVVRDIVTGFTGTITCRTEWLNKCIRYTVQPKMISKPDETQKLPEAAAFDEDQLELVSAPAAVAVPVRAIEPARRTGGDRPAATRAADPRR